MGGGCYVTCSGLRERCTGFWGGNQEERDHLEDFNVLLTVRLSITLVNYQLDAQVLYFIIRLLQSSTCFEQHRAHHHEVKLY